MTDLLGKEVNIDDTVVFTMPKYQHLLVGRISKITPKGVSCLWEHVRWLNDSDNVIPVPRHHQSSRDVISRLRHQFAKI